MRKGECPKKERINLAMITKKSKARALPSEKNDKRRRRLVRSRVSVITHGDVNLSEIKETLTAGRTRRQPRKSRIEKKVKDLREL